jgi:hypothetical protein
MRVILVGFLMGCTLLFVSPPAPVAVQSATGLVDGSFTGDVETAVRPDHEAEVPGAATIDTVLEEPSSTQTLPKPIRKLALLVGIDHYQYPEIPTLRGSVNDVLSMKKLLTTKFEFDPKDVVVLTDHAATRDAIVGAFREHLIAKSREPGDEVVVFHYSGHGSQRATNNMVDEPDGWDETLVTYDSGRGTHPNCDLIDDELGNLFQELRANTKLITFFLDNCFSGDGSKDIAQPREAPRDDRRPNAAEIAQRRLTGDGPRDYTQVTACESNERAYEYQVGGEYHGALSYFFLREVELTAKDGPTYQEIFEKAAPEVTQNFPAQHPQIEGEGRNREVFGVKASTVKPYVLVDPDGDGAVFQAGQVHGMTAGSLFDVYPPRTRAFDGQDPARFELTEVGPLTSKGKKKWAGGGAIQPSSRAVERAHNFANERIRVFVDPTIFDPQSRKRVPIASRLRDAVRERLDVSARLARAYTIAETETDAIFLLVPGKEPDGHENVELRRRNAQGTIRRFQTGDADSADRIMEELVRMAGTGDGGKGSSQGLFLSTKPEGREVLRSVRDRLTDVLALAATFQIVDQDGAPDLVVRRERTSASVGLHMGDMAGNQADETAISPSKPEDQPESVNQLLDQLNGWAKWLRLRRLRNTQGVNLASFRVERVGGEPPGQGASKGEDRHRLKVKVGDRVSLVVTNETEDNIYVTILDLSSDGEVEVLHPPGAPQPMKAGVTPWKLTIYASMKDGVNRIRDDLMLIATQRPVDFRFLKQEAPKNVDLIHEDPPGATKGVTQKAVYDDPLAQLISQAGLVQKGYFIPPRVDTDGWMTAIVLTEVVR